MARPLGGGGGGGEHLFHPFHTSSTVERRTEESARCCSRPNDSCWTINSGIKFKNQKGGGRAIVAYVSIDKCLRPSAFASPPHPAATFIPRMENLNLTSSALLFRAFFALSYHLICDEFPFLGHELKRQNLALGVQRCTKTAPEQEALTITILAGASVSSRPQQQQNKVLTTSVPYSAVAVSGMSSSSSSSPFLSSNGDVNGTLSEVPLRNLCFCNYGPSVCELEDTCIKHTRAACFHAILQEHSSETGSMQRYHFFGCAPLERGSDASHLTCNAWRAIHSSPRTIACCYEGNFCNENLTLPDLPALELSPDDLNDFPSRHGHSTAFSAPFAFLLFGFFVGLCLLLAFAVPIQCWLRKKNGKAKGILVDDVGSSSTESGTLLKKCQLKQQQSLGFEQSSSGSGGLALVQRSIALDLRMLEVFARGRYGELRKALYRGTVVAVKVFYTTEEESWLNERDIYQSQMLNHENILQYVAADILSSVESLTQMMLITDFHHLGSLYDYLRAGTLIELDEALQLALSSISGLEHLHNALRGTAGRTKPEIAHRDIKSKNVLVKRRGVCCLADFGLAVRFEKGEIIPSRVNIKVGTKRYMAPELLLGTLNVQNFDGFKSADIYSFALVLWEILNRVQMKDSSSCVLLPPAFPPASSVVFPSSPSALPLHVPGGVRHQWIVNSRSSGGGSSGFASSGGSADPFTNSLTMSGQHCQSHLQHYQQLFGAVQQQQGRQLVVMTETGGEDGKWRADSSESSQQQQQREHALPFRGMVDNDPSFEQMRQIVCVQKLRPPMESEWTDCANPLMSSLCLLITECWSEQPQSRHTALKVKKELMALIQRLRKE